MNRFSPLWHKFDLCLYSLKFLDNNEDTRCKLQSRNLHTLCLREFRRCDSLTSSTVLLVMTSNDQSTDNLPKTYQTPILLIHSHFTSETVCYCLVCVDFKQVFHFARLVFALKTCLPSALVLLQQMLYIDHKVHIAVSLSLHTK